MPGFRKSKASHDQHSANADMKAHGIPEGKPILVEYFSKPVTLPEGFLSPIATDSNAPPITMTPVDWKTTCIPENEGRYAVVLDNVLSRDECDELVRLAESSVDFVRLNDNSLASAASPTDAEMQEPWRPAMIMAGSGREVLDTTYRNSDRIVWDSQDVVDRLWARCCQGAVGLTLRQSLAVLDGSNETHHSVLGIWGGRRHWAGQGRAREKTRKWEMRRLNRRMRFLRYGPGQFFKPHCDGSYSEEVDGKIHRTFFTVHLYLNDSVAEAGQEKAELVGGATSFLSSNDERKVDVNPKAGRVLIFQHSGLDHAGDWVAKGIKYTMRTEIMYELVES